jgi:hypothetical protein
VKGSDTNAAKITAMLKEIIDIILVARHRRDGGWHTHFLVYRQHAARAPDGVEPKQLLGGPHTHARPPARPPASHALSSAGQRTQCTHLPEWCVRTRLSLSPSLSFCVCVRARARVRVLLLAVGSCSWRWAPPAWQAWPPRPGNVPPEQTIEGYDNIVSTKGKPALCT